VSTLQSNVGSYEIWANSAISSTNNSLSTLQSNVTTLFSNANFQNTWLSNLQSNVGTINSNVTAANLSISTLQSNVGSYESFANVWLGNLQANVGTINNNITNLSGNVSLTYVTNIPVTLGTTTATQSIFGLTNGVTLSSNTRYIYEISTEFQVTTSAPGDPTLGYSLAVGGSAVLAKHAYNVQMNNNGTRTDNSAGITMMTNDITTGFATSVVVASIKNTYNAALFKGVIDVTTGGNVNFMLTLSKAVTALSIPQLSYITLTPVGSVGANTAIGTWS